MNKDKILEMLERFEKIKEERDLKGDYVYMCIDITFSTYDSVYHSIYVKDENKKTHAVCKLKGFVSLTIKPEIETFADVLELLKGAEHV